MEIAKLQIAYLSNINKTKYLSKFTSFKGVTCPYDNFEMSPASKRKYYEERFKQNPNSAFLYNPDLPYEQKVMELKLHPEILPIGDVAAKLHLYSCNLRDDIFDFDYLPSKATSSLVRRRCIDCSSERNNETLRILEAKMNDITDFATFKRKFKISDETFRYYLKLGRFERFEVYPENAKKSGEHSRLIDKTSEINRRGIELHRLFNERSEYFDRLINARTRLEKIYVPVGDLAEFGIADTKLITSLIEKGVVEGKIDSAVDSDQTQHPMIVINLNDRKTQGVLQRLRDKECIRIEEFSRMYNIPVSELEEAYYDKKIDLCHKPLLLGDTGKVFVVRNSVKNTEYLIHKMLEKSIEHEILEQEKYKTNSLHSLKMKIAWELSPETRRIAKEVASEDKIIGSILHKKAEIEAQKMLLEQNISKSTGEIAEDEEEDDEKIPELNDFEKRKLKKFYKKMWQIAGVEEFNNARRKASEIIKEYKKSGIDAIEDANIKKLIKEYESSDK